MDQVKWRVLSVNHALTSQQGSESAHLVTLQAVAGGAVQGGQLTVRLGARPAYGPGDVIDYPPQPKAEEEESEPAKGSGAEGMAAEMRRGKGGVK